jgi:phosphatidate phosphatase APP1
MPDDWKSELRDLAGAVARRTADALGRLTDRDPYHVVGYRGYGTRERALVLGRALQDEGIPPADPAHSAWRNLLATLKRAESDPLRRARVRARFGGDARELEADDEGFVRAWLDAPAPLPSDGWHDVELELPDAPARRAGDSSGTPRALAPVLVPAGTAAFGVVSDMDDTVLQSEVTNFLRAARIMLLENARTRLPFPGVAAFYRALRGGTRQHGRNPIFYVSSSPWNLYDVIADFLAAHEIPVGPLLLRDWDLGFSLRRHHDHKGAHIREILATYPALPFILIGDSGQHDPEIYARVVRDHPGRILAVYIRNVTPEPARVASIRALAGEVRAAGSTLVLADDTLVAARHAAAHGWIAEDVLPAVGEEKRADEGTTTAKVETPGVEPHTAPTLVVDDEVRATDVE